MRYWWVNHKQTYRQETQNGYLWSPQVTQSGNANQFYDNMTHAAPGDLVFSYAHARIRDVGIVTQGAKEAPKPQEFGAAGQNWNDQGWLVLVDYQPTPHSITPKEHWSHLQPLMPSKYAPLNQNGEGNQGAYLAEISEELARYLLNEAFDQPERSAMLTEAQELEEEVAVFDDPKLTDTEREQLSRARVGQGRFRQAVSEREPRCRVTGLSERIHVRASHMKPWRDSSHEERLDGDNGLLLAVHIDHLFDRGFITFTDDGQLLTSPNLTEQAKSAFQLPNQVSDQRPFSDKQLSYLHYHREHIYQGDA